MSTKGKASTKLLNIVQELENTFFAASLILTYLWSSVETTDKIGSDFTILNETGRTKIAQLQYQFALIHLHVHAHTHTHTQNYIVLHALIQCMCMYMYVCMYDKVGTK